MAMQGFYAVDRFEGEYAVCEGPDGGMHNFVRVELPRGTREGDVLLLEETGWKIDRQQTAERREKARALFESLLE
ncbi:MAG: DUF3006 domain-containing protein [Provencibacterium sp.]|jgi:hypothetical protein|nr:DUF3006 domain-containing protein [Provencibacterium sp.]